MLDIELVLNTRLLYRHYTLALLFRLLE